MKATGRTWTVAYCLSLFMALTLLTSDYVWAPVRYKLGAGDAIDFSTVTKANQGSGSGLDADMLDGKEGSEYLTGSSSTENTFTIGDGNNTDKYYQFNKGGSNLPGIRWNAQNSKVQVTHDGTTYKDVGSAATTEEGDTQKVANTSTLDFDADDFVVTESPTGEANIALEDAVKFSGKTTDDLAEGSTNLYHTDARFDTRLGTKTTDDLTEGSSNKYNPFGTSIDSSEITDGTITNSDINATSDLDNNARLAVRKNTGGSDVGERRRLNLIEGSNVTLTVTDDPTNEEVDVTIAASGGSGDTSVLESNILLNAFRIAVNAAMAVYNMVDGIMDVFTDETGVDTGSSTGQTYDATNDLYYPTLGLEDSETYGTGGTDDDGEYSLAVPADVVAINYGTGGTDDDAQHDSAITTSSFDSYADSNFSSDGYMYDSPGLREVGQAITLSAAKNIKQVKFYLRKESSPTGNARVKIYAATGTVGTTATPTGSALATSDTLDVSTLTTSYAWYTFTFSTAYAASASDYCLSFEIDAGNSPSNYVRCGRDVTPSHAGNAYDTTTPGSGYTAQSGQDYIFDVIEELSASEIAQSFTVGGTSITATKVKAYMLQTSSADGSVECRIETDNSNKPSGTLAFANATKTITAASISGTAAWTEFALTASGSLSASTKYWIVIKRVSSPAQGTVSVRYDGSSPSYANGACAVSTDSGSSWTIHDGTPNHDCLFEIYKPGDHTHYAQKITLPSSQTLAQIRLYMRESSCDGNVKVEIQGNDVSGGDHPNSTVLTSLSVTASSISDTNGWNIWNFSDYAAGAIKVWAVIYRDSDTAGTLYIRYDGSSPGYSGGGTNSSTDSGSTWGTEDTAKDLLFRLEKLSEGMTLISNAFTAEAVPTDSRIVLFEEDVDAITINTDLTVEVSRDGGTTYTSVTLTDEGDYASSKRIIAGTADISGQPSGTSMEYRIKSLNSKNLKLHGIGHTWN